ncbi:MAG: YncE family protein [Longimicrobiales bacterium]
MIRHSSRSILFLAIAFGCAKPQAEPQPDIARSGPGSILRETTALAPPPERLYVTNQADATVTVIDTRTNTVLRTVDLQKLGFSANAKPHHVQVEPDGSYWYVTLIGENRIVKLTFDDKVVASTTFETPGMLTLDPDNGMMYVGRSMTAVNPPHRIGAIRRSDMTMGEVEVLFPRPHAMALQRRTQMVYTASLGVNQIAAMEVATERVTVTDVAGPQHSLMQFAISPDGNMMVVSGELSAKLLVFDIATDPKKPRLMKTIDVGAQPFDPIFTHDGRWVYLGNKAANTVTVIDARNWSVAEVVKHEGLSQPHGTAVSVDGRYVYVSNNNLKSAASMPGMDHSTTPMAAPPNAGGNGTIVVFDAASHRVVKVIEVGHNAAGIATPSMR